MPFLRFIPVASISAENAGGRGVGLAPVAVPLAAFLVKLPHVAPTKAPLDIQGPSLVLYEYQFI